MCRESPESAKTYKFLIDGVYYPRSLLGRDDPAVIVWADKLKNGLGTAGYNNSNNHPNTVNALQLQGSVQSTTPPANYDVSTRLGGWGYYFSDIQTWLK